MLPRAELVGQRFHGTLATTDEIKHAEKLGLGLAIVLDVAAGVNDFICHRMAERIVLNVIAL